MAAAKSRGRPSALIGVKSPEISLGGKSSGFIYRMNVDTARVCVLAFESADSPGEGGGRHLGVSLITLMGIRRPPRSHRS